MRREIKPLQLKVEGEAKPNKPTVRNQVAYSNKGTVQVNSRLNVRTGASTKHKIVGKLYAGNTVDIVAKDTSDTEYPLWYKINYKGSTAYVCANYVKVTDKEEVPKIPNVDTSDTQNNQDHFILTGSASVKPNVKLKPREVCNLQGLGKYLSGAYYIEEVTFSIDNSGLSQEILVSKNAFGDSLKSPTKPKPPSETKPPVTEVKPETSERTHKFKRGDTLWGLAKQYYGNGSKWTHIAKANNIDEKDDKRIRSIQIGEVFKIPYL